MKTGEPHVQPGLASERTRIEGTARITSDLSRLLAEFGAVGRFKFWLALLLLLLSGLSEGISILILLPVLQLAANDKAGSGYLNLADIGSGTIPLPDISVTLATVLGFFVGFVLLQVLFNRLKSIFLSDLMFDFVNARRRALFRAIAQSRWDKIVRMSVSELEHALNGEVDRIATCGMYLLAIVQCLILLCVYLTLSFMTSAIMTGIMIVFGVVTFLVMRPFRQRASAYGHLLQTSRERQFRTVSDFLGGLKSARATNSENTYFEAFSDLLERNKKDARDFARYNATGSGLFQVFTTIGAALFILIAVNWLALDFPRIVILLLLAMRIAPQFLSLQTQMQAMLVDLPAWRHVNKIEQELVQAEDSSAKTRQLVPPLQQGIELNAVNYHYDPAAAPALDKLSLKINARQVTALIGPSGSGKSTVADLVTGLIRPDGGDLLFDGCNLNPTQLRGWRDLVGYVSQESFLMNATIRENLVAMLGRDPSESEIWEALEQACAAEFVRGFPEGLQTQIGDRGVRVSGGQRQRIALARTLLRRPDFLVLDEATSALDWAAQEHVANSIRKLAQDGMTVLTIAHRPSMVAFADMVYALDHGRLVEAGNRKELEKNKNSAFYQMLQAEKGLPAKDDPES